MFSLSPVIAIFTHYYIFETGQLADVRNWKMRWTTTILPVVKTGRRICSKYARTWKEKACHAYYLRRTRLVAAAALGLAEGAAEKLGIAQLFIK
jgi:hypothetical protein